MAEPQDDYQTKARALRKLYRDMQPKLIKGSRFDYLCQADQAERTRACRAEYERLFGEPSTNGALEYIESTVWIEHHHVAGHTYSPIRQKWVDAEGNVVD